MLYLNNNLVWKFNHNVLVSKIAYKFGYMVGRALLYKLNDIYH